MNPIKKIYCRIFQIVFRIALPVLPYRNPEILKHTAEIPGIIKKENLLHPLIITDANLKKLDIFKNLTVTLEKAGINKALFCNVSENPTSQMVDEALTVYGDNGCNCIIAFGGGSPIDCAKAVAARLARPKKSLAEMAGILKVVKKTPVLIAIPTTAGTGSETTLAAVIVDDKTRHKYVINDFPLIPKYAVLDADNIHTMPASIAATTGMDALTHAVEAYIGRSTTKSTRADAVKAVKLIFENIENAAAHKSTEAEENMLLASHLAGRAFTRSYVGYIHAVSHSLSGKYNMPHGLTNAILLPIVLDMYGESAYKKLAKLSVAVGLGRPQESDKILAEKFINAIYALNKNLGIPAHIEGIMEDDIDMLSKYADKEANPLYPVPVLWDAQELKKIYRKAALINER